jgi:malto-oligosyltrehalose synthase/malto-oligosyltrehalose trehalohydrolase
MPFGATVLDGGGVRFRLWAPAPRRIELAWAGAHGEERHEAPPGSGGWRDVVLPHAGAGDAYRWIVHADGGEVAVPDPASRSNPDGVHAPSRVVDPRAFPWDDTERAWKGRPWHEAVVYELHVGAYTDEGTYAAAQERLPALADAGVTAIQLMPLASFSGHHGWGYDGVLPYAPHPTYGTPHELKCFVQAAHRLGLMVLVDVVYNHFGPDGNYLALYAPAFFDERRQTAWGAALHFDGPQSRVVRDFFIHNALYWLEEFHADGLRLDAVHAIRDTSTPDILQELASHGHALGRAQGRHVHLVLENERNDARRLTAGDDSGYDAQWNDHFHHAVHVLLTGEHDGYYAPFAHDPVAALARCLTCGFTAGEVPLRSVLNFLHDHDQIGNRAFGERLLALAGDAPMRLAVAILLLAPSPPMLFMGDEIGATTPFLYFADWSGELRDAVTEGRRREFAHFPAFADPATRERIPDPCDAATFAGSRIDHAAVDDAWARCYRDLLALRRRELWPRLERLLHGKHEARRPADRVLVVRWRFDDAVLEMTVNLNAHAVAVPADTVEGELLHVVGDVQDRALGPWSGRWRWIAAAELDALPDLATAVIPRATYRVQLHAGMRFCDATRLVPYLDALGMSHLYASPVLKARAGSNHGYDVVDPRALNPEIGTDAEHAELCATLARRGMHVLQDIVPNHMGVLEADNAWWLDVLECGGASVHADTFDIDWRPPSPELRGRVLVPVLGDHYGRVLEAGELRLAFDATDGTFFVAYHGHRFPVDPRHYPDILTAAGELPREGVPTRDAMDVQSLVEAFARLPDRDDESATARATRQRDKPLLKRRLAQQHAQHAWLREHVARGLAAFEGRAGEPASFDALDTLIARQAWRLAYWMVAGDDVNYRRFFDINTLAALRADRPRVFEATHARVLQWLRDGRVQGLRVDHPDGLADPHGYLERLQRAHVRIRRERGEEPRALYLVVEKILAEHEHLPPDWPAHGDTGYRYSNLVQGLFVDAEHEAAFDAIHRSYAQRQRSFDDMLDDAKRLIMSTSLAADLQILTSALHRIAVADRRTRDYTRNRLRGALAELAAAFPVYRTYLGDHAPSEVDRGHLDWAAAAARRRAVGFEMSALEFVRHVLLHASEETDPVLRRLKLRFVKRWQQFTAPVMAKAMEDTAFYRDHRLDALNDVGGDPRRFGVSVAAFHAANTTRWRFHPHAMLGTTTHDTKRSEDVRARLAVLSEMPQEWHAALERWRALNAPRAARAEVHVAPHDELLLYQTLVGVWPHEPVDAAALASLRERVQAYMRKAVREAKELSSWIDPNVAYEAALSQFIDQLLAQREPNPFLTDFEAFVAPLARFGCINSLNLVALKLTSPGVPDVYQGTEVWSFSLVDPDNRRAVDFEALRRMLEGLPQEVETDLTDPRAKLRLTSRLLALRRRWPLLFERGSYVPLAVEGPAAAHVVAYARAHEDTACVVVATRLPFARERAGMGWHGTRVVLPAGASSAWQDVTSGAPVVMAGPSELDVAGVLARWPVAVLTSEGDLGA